MEGREGSEGKRVTTGIQLVILKLYYVVRGDCIGLESHLANDLTFGSLNEKTCRSLLVGR